MSDFVLSVISGAVGGLIVLLFQKVWDYNDKRREEAIETAEKQKKLIISPHKHLQYVESRIIDHLLPGTSIEKMKDILGVPDFTGHQSVITDLSEEATLTNTYSFKFLNADLLLTSVDNQSIDSITISSNDITEYPVEFYSDSPNSNVLGKMKVEQDIVDHVVFHTVNRTVRDAYFCIELYWGWAGQYQYFTLFGNDFDAVIKYQKSPNLKHLVGRVVTSYCISNKEHFAPGISRF
jgi:hypothetical protein